jgi:hypothetical protein
MPRNTDSWVLLNPHWTLLEPAGAWTKFLAPTHLQLSGFMHDPVAVGLFVRPPSPASPRPAPWLTTANQVTVSAHEGQL